MADPEHARLKPLRQLAEAVDDKRLLDLVIATVEIMEKDTALVLDQSLIASELAARTKAGDWIGNTELSDVISDASYFVRVYKQQREEIGQLKAVLRDKQSRLSSGPAQE